MDTHIDSSQIQAAEMAVVRAWAGLLTGAEAEAAGEEAERHSTEVPFSFTCGGASSRDWLEVGNSDCESGEWRDGKRLHLLRWRDGKHLPCLHDGTHRIPRLPGAGMGRPLGVRGPGRDSPGGRFQGAGPLLEMR